MRAMEFTEFGAPSVMKLVDKPLPAVPPGGLRIRIHAIGVNPADTKWRSGMMQSFSPRELPLVVGYDVAGIVDVVSNGLEGFSPGDRVFACLSPMDMGGYAEYAAAEPLFVAKIPDGLTFEEAASLPTPGLTAFQLIEEHVRPAAGSRVLITGAVGAVGRLAVFAAKRIGAEIVAAVRGSQRDEAIAIGADHVAVLGEDWTGAPFDHVADTVGGEIAADLCRSLTSNGTIHTVAMPPLYGSNLPTQPQFVAIHPDAEKLSEIGQLCAAGAFKMPLARTLTLSEAPEAHRIVEAGGVNGKVVLLVD